MVPGTQTATQVTLRTYVYQLGSKYYPRDPVNVTFAYTVLGAGESSVVGSTAFCNSAVYSVSNLYPGSTVTWSASPVGIVNLVPIPNTTQVTAIKQTQGNVTITATVSGIISAPYSINVTTIPQVSSVTAMMSGACSNGIQTYTLSAVPNLPTGATNWSWTVDNSTSGITLYSPNAQNTTAIVSKGGGVSVTYKDQCGEISQRNGVTIYSSCGHAFVVSPNPVSSAVNVSVSASSVSSTSSSTISEINIYDDQGNLKKHSLYSKVKTVSINANDLRLGMYIILLK